MGALRVLCYPCAQSTPLHAGPPPPSSRISVGATFVPRVVHNHRLTVPTEAALPGLWGGRLMGRLTEGAVAESGGPRQHTAPWAPREPLCLEGGLGSGDQDTQRPGSCPRSPGGWAGGGGDPGSGWAGLGPPNRLASPLAGASGGSRQQRPSGGCLPCPHRAAPGWPTQSPSSGPGERECRAGWKKALEAERPCLCWRQGGGPTCI